MSKKITIGLVGGGIGRQHMDGFNLLPDQFSVIGFCDLDAERRTRYAEEFSIPQVTDNYQELLDNPDIDVIDICTPPFLHFDQVTAALKAGKHVICEKPLVGSLKQLDEIIALSEKTGKHVLPVYQYRYGHGLQKLLHLRDKGVLGTPYMANIEIAWRRGGDYFAVPWRGKINTHLGGCLADQSIHMHDIITLVMGEAAAVTTRMRTLVNPVETEDCAAVILEMEGGALATEAITLGAAREKTRLKFFFRNMTVISDHDQQYRPQDEPWDFQPADDETRQAMQDALLDFNPGFQGYAGLFDAYYQARKAGAVLPVTLDDARRSLGVVSGMYASAQTGQTVSLPVDEGFAFYDGWHKPELAKVKVA